MKSFEVLWTKNAEFDLESIVEYIKTDSISVAKDLFFKIKKQCNQLSSFPNSGRIVPELQQIGISTYRELVYKRWRIIYKIEKEIVYILIVVDSSREIEDMLFGRLLK